MKNLTHWFILAAIVGFGLTSGTRLAKHIWPEEPMKIQHTYKMETNNGKERMQIDSGI